MSKPSETIDERRGENLYPVSFAAEFGEHTLKLDCPEGVWNPTPHGVHLGHMLLELDFTGEWTENASVTIKMGLGSLELRLPRGLGVRLEKSTFLAALDSQGMVKRGDAYYSLDYEEADVRLTIDIDAAFGSIDVVWVR